MKTRRPLVVLSELALIEGGLKLSWELTAGQKVAIMGASGSGKSLLLDVILGAEAAVRGKATLAGRATAAGMGGFGRRDTPLSVAKAISPGLENVVETLSALSLWESRESRILDLPPGLAAACDLIEPLLGSEEIVAFDGNLDQLDPWTLRAVLDYMDSQARLGRAFLVVTNNPAAAEKMGGVIVLREGSARFAGTVLELMRHARPAELLVETDDESLVSEVMKPFAISIRKARQGMLVKTEKGQEAAAELLLKGYGRVKSVLVKEPSFEEALMEIY